MRLLRTIGRSLLAIYLPATRFFLGLALFSFYPRMDHADRHFGRPAFFGDDQSILQQVDQLLFRQDFVGQLGALRLIDGRQQPFPADAMGQFFEQQYFFFFRKSLRARQVEHRLYFGFQLVYVLAAFAPGAGRAVGDFALEQFNIHLVGMSRAGRERAEIFAKIRAFP